MAVLPGRIQFGSWRKCVLAFILYAYCLLFVAVLRSAVECAAFELFNAQGGSMNNRSHFRPGTLLAALMLVLTPALAQQNQTTAAPGGAAVAPAKKNLFAARTGSIGRAHCALSGCFVGADFYGFNLSAGGRSGRRAGSRLTRKLPERRLRMRWPSSPGIQRSNP
jgi:hypothetical protein